MTRRVFLRATTAAACATVIGSCGESVSTSSKQVVLYTSADDTLAREVAKLFEARTGIRVLLTGDTEATKTTGLVQRLRTERAAPRADVFWSSEIFQTIHLAREGLFEPHDGPEAAARAEQWKDPQRLWHAFGKRARVLVRNTKTISPEDAPTTFRELVEGRFRGRVVMADPRFGTTRGHMGVLLHLWGEQAFTALFTGLGGNKLRLLDGNSTVVQSVAYGEAHVGITDTDDVWAGQRNGWPVDMTMLRHDAGNQGTGPRRGTLVIPNTVARIAGGPNPEHAATLTEFLLSAEVERLLAESDSHHNPVRQDVAGPAEQYLIYDAMDIDYSAAADKTDRAVDLIFRVLRG
jgi:iron(III) transport system substrate-binding protein